MRADPKKHKRTPSFTTRRRTQSFRRHTKNLNTMENLPPVEVDGFLDRKQVQSCLLLIKIQSPEQRNQVEFRSFNPEASEQRSVLGKATTQSFADSSCVSSGWLRKSTSSLNFDSEPNHSRDQEDFFEAKAASSPIMIYQVTNSNKSFFR